MKTIKVHAKKRRDEDYLLLGVEDLDQGDEINAPSTLLNLLRLKKKLHEPLLGKEGFKYDFPITFPGRLITNSFKLEFPIIFENYGGI